MIRWARNEGYAIASAWSVSYAATHLHIETVKYLVKDGFPVPRDLYSDILYPNPKILGDRNKTRREFGMIEEHAEIDLTEKMIRYVHDELKLRWSRDTMRSAMKRGNIKLIKIIRELGCPWRNNFFHLPAENQLEVSFVVNKCM